MRRSSAGAQSFADNSSMQCLSIGKKGICERLRNSALLGTCSTGLVPVLVLLRPLTWGERLLSNAMKGSQGRQKLQPQHAHRASAGTQAQPPHLDVLIVHIDAPRCQVVPQLRIDGHHHIVLHARLRHRLRGTSNSNCHRAESCKIPCLCMATSKRPPRQDLAMLRSESLAPDFNDWRATCSYSQADRKPWAELKETTSKPWSDPASRSARPARRCAGRPRPAETRDVRA